MAQNKYRNINNIKDEGLWFYLLVRSVAYFYTNVMRGQVRKYAPDSLIKYYRDWEYPWVLMKFSIKPGNKVLDSGAGYSPVPFLWSNI